VLDAEFVLTALEVHVLNKKVIYNFAAKLGSAFCYPKRLLIYLGNFVNTGSEGFSKSVLA
jgi:hypothetical protein